jgi:hypothetical protein
MAGSPPDDRGRRAAQNRVWGTAAPLFDGTALNRVGSARTGERECDGAHVLPPLAAVENDVGRKKKKGSKEERRSPRTRVRLARRQRELAAAAGGE